MVVPDGELPPRPPRRGPAGIRVRRARDREPAPPAPAPAPAELPLVDELFRPEGRAVLERLVRQHGARRAALAGALAAGWRRADGRPLGDEDVDRLLEEHGLARAFARRERALLLHAVRAAGGVRARAAAALGLSAEALAAALRRLGGGAEEEAVREERRAELRRRATLSERVRLLFADEERLADLGLLDEVVADLRARLPEHLKALRASGAGPLAPALGRTLSLSRAAVDALARRIGLDLGVLDGEAQRPGRSPAARRAEPRGAGGRRPPRKRRR